MAEAAADSLLHDYDPDLDAEAAEKQWFQYQLELIAKDQQQDPLMRPSNYDKTVLKHRWWFLARWQHWSHLPREVLEKVCAYFGLSEHGSVDNLAYRLALQYQMADSQGCCESLGCMEFVGKDHEISLGPRDVICVRTLSIAPVDYH